MPQRQDDLDFKIFVDPSCLSDPMDDESSAPAQPISADEVPKITDIPDTPVDIPVSDQADANASADSNPVEADTEPQTEIAAEQQEQLDAADEQQEQHDVVEDQEEHNHSTIGDDSYDDDAATHHEDDTHQDDNGDVGDESIADDSLLSSGDVDTPEVADEFSREVEPEEQAQPEVEEQEAQPEAQEDSFVESDVETPKPVRTRQSDADDAVAAPQSPRYTDRKASLRTEALIQAAARAVVAKLENRNSGRDSLSHHEEEADQSLLSTGTQETYDDDHSSRRESMDSQIHHEIASHPGSGDEGGDSSSHHEADDDVFSDRSARSSIGSFDASGEDNTAKPSDRGSPSLRQSFDSAGRSPRISGVSIISGLSQYDKDDFVPTSRDTRVPFRTPSAVRAMQMASPTPSVFSGGSPRSSKRQTGFGSVPRSAHLQSPTVSAQYSPKGRSTPTRLKPRKEAPLVLLHVTLLPLRWIWGDALNALDSTSGKALDENKDLYEASEQLKTLRDAWRELQDCVGETILERGILIPHPQNDIEVLEERLLEALDLPLRRRARILECGHYLGPANMSEDDCDETDDECENQAGTKEENRHWCKTCKGDIKYESLGAGKVFRVKVYASNGLMKAGAWEACWKDMERVDVEVEPIVEPVMQGELEKLVAIQIDQEEQRQKEEADAEIEAELQRQAEMEQADKEHTKADESIMDDTLPIPSDPELPYERRSRSAVMSSPPPPSSMQIMHASPPQDVFSPPRVSSPAMAHSSRSMHEPMDTSEERRRRDEERMREIYGDAPPLPYDITSSVHAEPASSQPRHPDSYIPPPTPRSPSEEAWERRQQRDAHRRALDDASFIELMLEAFKVLLRDSKNVAIIVLCLFLVCLMIRPTPHVPSFEHNRLAYGYEAKQEVAVHTTVAKVETHVVVQPEKSTATTVEAIVAAPSVESIADLVMAGPVAAPEALSQVPVESTPLTQPRPALDGPPADPTLEIQQESSTVLPAEDVVPDVAEQEATLQPAVEDAPISEASAEEESAEEEPAVAVELPSDEIVATADLESGTEDPSLSKDMNESETVEPVAAVPVTEDSPDQLESADPEPTVEATDSLLELSSEAEVPLTDGDANSDNASPFVSSEIRVETENLEVESVSATSTEATATVDADAPEPTSTHPCESYAQSVRCNANMATSISPVSHIFPITERKTIRVYETITETVRVSVTATETSTASEIETAVPQTVEETVYETETVRVTVSIPVDSAPEPTLMRDEL
ncbi:hypothetical protein QBC47DRAFT_383910 [Echria macrotheca]|uniref:Pathway-specific nitrogen regulator n=1 Tax=Echria macrotheca TaxID=438768 RepID=A0AAJ0BEJ9_9PEZI|nr:hypothetical protein QBC47DRAFT_383910 [Echria macrotheca]